MIAKLLSTVCQCSRSTGEVPEDWRFVIVMPIYKKGHKEDPGNYRSVSLTSVPGMVIEQMALSDNHMACVGQPEDQAQPARVGHGPAWPT